MLYSRALDELYREGITTDWNREEELDITTMK